MANFTFPVKDYFHYISKYFLFERRRHAAGALFVLDRPCGRGRRVTGSRPVMGSGLDRKPNPWRFPIARCALI